MSILFEPLKIGAVEIPNRFVRSATWEGMAAADGSVTDRLVDLYGCLAQGGIGLIISSNAYVEIQGRTSTTQAGIHDDTMAPGWKRIAGEVHRTAGKFFIQLAHGGYFATKKITGEAPFGPSVLEGPSKEPRREISAADIERVIMNFGLAAVRAREAGADGVQIHAAHGYLMSQFLSPYFNRRSDSYGGTVANRARILIAAVRAIKKQAGDAFPVIAKINSEDGLKGGLAHEEFIEAALMLSRAGLDGIEVSGGSIIAGPLNPSRKVQRKADEAYFRDAARKLKSRIGIPVILVGGIRSFDVAEEIIKSKDADFVAMSRPFIREPSLVQRWRSGDLRPAGCVSDNHCYGPAETGEGIYCVTEKHEQQ